jgi:hypothetical protein
MQGEDLVEFLKKVFSLACSYGMSSRAESSLAFLFSKTIKYRPEFFCTFLLSSCSTLYCEGGQIEIKGNDPFSFPIGTLFGFLSGKDIAAFFAYAMENNTFVFAQCILAFFKDRNIIDFTISCPWNTSYPWNISVFPHILKLPSILAAFDKFSEENNFEFFNFLNYKESQIPNDYTIDEIVQQSVTPINITTLLKYFKFPGGRINGFYSKFLAVYVWEKEDDASQLAALREVHQSILNSSLNHFSAQEAFFRDLVANSSNYYKLNFIVSMALKNGLLFFSGFGICDLFRAFTSHNGESSILFPSDGKMNTGDKRQLSHDLAIVKSIANIIIKEHPDKINELRSVVNSSLLPI